MVAEDGAQHLVAVSAGGRTAVFARNALSGSELTGVCFSPDRRTLFVGIQDEGFVLAARGPSPPTSPADAGVARMIRRIAPHVVRLDALG